MSRVLRTYRESASYCRSLGSLWVLASIHSSRENAQVLALLKRSGGGAAYYLGATETATNGHQLGCCYAR